LAENHEDSTGHPDLRYDRWLSRATITNSVSWFKYPEAIMELGQRESLEERVKHLERELAVMKERLADAPARHRMRFPLSLLIITILLFSLDLTLIRGHLRLPAAITGPGNVGVVIAAFNLIFAFAVGLIYGRTARLIGWSVIIGVCLLFSVASFSVAELVFDVVSNHNAYR
jgi:hypothetical protein